MNVNNGYWINDSYSSLHTGENLINKFAYLATQPPNAYCTLELWYARANGKIIKFSDYNSGAQTTLRGPLTSLRVGDGPGANGETVTTSNLFLLGQGYTNYTNFMNRILKRHGLGTRFYPMGIDYTIPSSTLSKPNIWGNNIGCDLSTVEDFALTFIEKPTLISSPSTGKQPYITNTIFHVESVAPLSLIAFRKGYVAPFLFNALKTPYGGDQFLIDQVGWIFDNRITQRPERT